MASLRKMTSIIDDSFAAVEIKLRDDVPDHPEFEKLAKLYISHLQAKYRGCVINRDELFKDLVKEKHSCYMGTDALYAGFVIGKT